ncbi:MAG: [acyl-carrier-protein] S-malonyltransferase [Phototrophicales bacterium]|nr:MAG: [acyl-carrier-protein] S-malonyltransferase [Phototrophicales bacterium]
MIDWTTTALIFPGQGSQVVGMGRDLVAAYPAAADLYQQADELLGFAFSRLCFEGPEETLNDTINTQPALYVAGMATLAALRAELGDIQPKYAAGHSLGEFTALAAAGALTFEDGLKLVRERGRLMKEAGERNPGAMAALLGLDAEQVRQLCAEASAAVGGVLVLANDNCPGQIVISGENETLEKGLELAKAAGAKRAVKLAVSIAAHSPLMESAASAFRAVLAQTPFQTPNITVYGNVNAAPLNSADAVRGELDAQLTQPVRWTESVRRMIAGGAFHFIELGPKDVLTGLLKRIDSSKSGIALNSARALQDFAKNQP